MIPRYEIIKIFSPSKFSPIEKNAELSAARKKALFYLSLLAAGIGLPERIPPSPSAAPEKMGGKIFLEPWPLITAELALFCSCSTRRFLLVFLKFAEKKRWHTKIQPISRSDRPVESESCRFLSSPQQSPLKKYAELAKGK